MRDYAKVAPQFWTGKTGRQIRSLGRDAQVVALYLITCPSGNMLGLYYLPLPTLCHEVGSPSQGALKALRRLSEAHFCYYDEAEEVVWVPEMAKYQVGEVLKPDDKRVSGIKNTLKPLRNKPFFNDFLAKYRDAYHLHDISPFEAPSKPLRSQEQEQEKEQEQKQKPVSASPNGFDRFWSAYPKKKAKGDAEKAWKNIKPDSDLLATILAAIDRAKGSEDWTKDSGKYIPFPATWLRAKRWEDEEVSKRDLPDDFFPFPTNEDGQP